MNGRPLREWFTGTVQWGPARNTTKRVAYAAARVRARRVLRTGTPSEILNIFTAMTPRSGSQWAKALFDHEIVRAHTGLFTLPQLVDQFGRGMRPFPAGTFVPGIYASYEGYLEIPKPFPYRTVYVFRDPRDVVVSAYFSALNTHRKIREYEQLRAVMREMPRDPGIHLTIELLAGRLQEMATWVDVVDENVALFRLEDISADPEPEVHRMLMHCGVHLEDRELAQVLADTSRDSLQQQDLAHRKAGSESHYRIDRRSHHDVLKAEHIQAIEDAVPGLIKRLGYGT